MVGAPVVADEEILILPQCPRPKPVAVKPLIGVAIGKRGEIGFIVKVGQYLHAAVWIGDDRLPPGSVGGIVFEGDGLPGHPDDPLDLKRGRIAKDQIIQVGIIGLEIGDNDVITGKGFPPIALLPGFGPAVIDDVALAIVGIGPGKGDVFPVFKFVAVFVQGRVHRSPVDVKGLAID